MKRILATFLAVIMTLGVFAVGASALTFDELTVAAAPVEVEPEAGVQSYPGKPFVSAEMNKYDNELAAASDLSNLGYILSSLNYALVEAKGEPEAAVIKHGIGCTETGTTLTAPVSSTKPIGPGCVTAGADACVIEKAAVPARGLALAKKNKTDAEAITTGTTVNPYATPAGTVYTAEAKSEVVSHYTNEIAYWTAEIAYLEAELKFWLKDGKTIANLDAALNKIGEEVDATDVGKAWKKYYTALVTEDGYDKDLKAYVDVVETAGGAVYVMLDNTPELAAAKAAATKVEQDKLIAKVMAVYKPYAAALYAAEEKIANEYVNADVAAYIAAADETWALLMKIKAFADKIEKKADFLAFEKTFNAAFSGNFKYKLTVKFGVASYWNTTLFNPSRFPAEVTTPAKKCMVCGGTTTQFCEFEGPYETYTAPDLKDLMLENDFHYIALMKFAVKQGIVEKFDNWQQKLPSWMFWVLKCPSWLQAIFHYGLFGWVFDIFPNYNSAKVCEWVIKNRTTLKDYVVDRYYSLDNSKSGRTLAGLAY